MKIGITLELKFWFLSNVKEIKPYFSGQTVINNNNNNDNLLKIIPSNIGTYL